MSPVSPIFYTVETVILWLHKTLQHQHLEKFDMDISLKQKELKDLIRIDITLLKYLNTWIKIASLYTLFLQHLYSSSRSLTLAAEACRFYSATVYNPAAGA